MEYEEFINNYKINKKYDELSNYDNFIYFSNMFKK